MRHAFVTWYSSERVSISWKKIEHLILIVIIFLAFYVEGDEEKYGSGSRRYFSRNNIKDINNYRLYKKRKLDSY